MRGAIWALLLAVFGCAAPPSAPPQWQAARQIGGSELRVTLRHSDESMARTAITEALDAAEAVHAKLRPTGAGSEIDLLGKVPSHLWVEVSRTTWQALAVGASVAEATEGAYDYTSRPLLKPWGLRPGDTPRVPRGFEIESALRRVDWEDVEIRDADGLEARRLTRRTEIDLGPLAEGAAIDAAADQLQALGVVAARMDMGRVHRVFGGSQEHPWRVALEDSSLVLREGAVAEVSRGEAVQTQAGQAVYRKLDPRDGEPVASLWSAALTTRAADAACWAEALLALGEEEGRALVASLPELKAMITGPEGETWSSEGMPGG